MNAIDKGSAVDSFMLMMGNTSVASVALVPEARKSPRTLSKPNLQLNLSKINDINNSNNISGKNTPRKPSDNINVITDRSNSTDREY